MSEAIDLLSCKDGSAMRSSGQGMSGHQSARAKTHTWLTPTYLIEALGEFELDPCAAPSPRPWDTARNHYTAPHQDGLSLPWDGRVWLNPPYGDESGAWLAKLALHQHGTALIFARTETEVFQDHVWGQSDALLFLRGRLHFHHPNGHRAKANAGAPSVLCAYGADDAERLRFCGLPGYFQPLKIPVLLHMVMLPDRAVPENLTWKEIVLDAVKKIGGTAKLGDIYAFLESHPRVRASKHWQDKIRQTIGRLELTRVGLGQYALAL